MPSMWAQPSAYAPEVPGMSWSAVHASRSLRKPRSYPEDTLQRTVIEFVRYAMTYRNRPLTDWLYAVPNGGKRNAREAARLKTQGVKAGVNDLVLPIAVAPYGGLYIELKVGRNNLSDVQMDFHQRLREGGQKVVTCWTLAAVVEAVREYLAPTGLFNLRVS